MSKFHFATFNRVSLSTALLTAKSCFRSSHFKRKKKKKKTHDIVDGIKHGAAWCGLRYLQFEFVIIFGIAGKNWIHTCFGSDMEKGYENELQEPTM